MNESSVTNEQMLLRNILVVLGLSLVIAFLLMCFIFQILKVHQFDPPGMIGGDLSVAKPLYTYIMADYGTIFSTFRHGALHCFLAGLFLALPIIGTNALFEKESLITLWQQVVFGSYVLQLWEE